MDIAQQFFDSEKYKKANEVFDTFIKKCNTIQAKKVKVSDFTISTITCISFIAKEIDIKRICQFLTVTDDNHLEYIEADNIFKGTRKHKSAGSSLKKDKKKKKADEQQPTTTVTKNQLFSNQMSIGIKCLCPTHVGKNAHKNPISVKIFRNGRIQMTGCKDKNEIKTVYKILYNELAKIPTHYKYKGKIVKIMSIKGLIPFEDAKINVEMLNGTFKVGTKLNLENIMNYYKTKYTKNDVFRTINKKSRINLSIKKFQYFDKKKSKWKMPQVFIYNTGSVNIIATTHKLLEQAYNLLKKDMTEQADVFSLKRLIMNKKFINDYRRSKNRTLIDEHDTDLDDNLSDNDPDILSLMDVV